MSDSEESKQRKKAIVIGAGAGGIAIAARLAKAGLAVTVLEKNSFTGGRCSLLYHHHHHHHHPEDENNHTENDNNNNSSSKNDDDNNNNSSSKNDDDNNNNNSPKNDDDNPDRNNSSTTRGTYRFDQGPSLLLLPQLFHETFSDLSTSLAAEGVALLRCATHYVVYFADGGTFTLSSDLVSLKSQVDAIEGPGGFGRFLAWLGEAHAHSETSQRAVLHRNFPSLGSLALCFARSPASALRLHPFHGAWARAARYFRSERLRRVFTFATMYVGMSPFAAPATYSLLPGAELLDGIWYPRGGFHAVLGALERVGRRLGVEYRLGAPVSQILFSSSSESSCRRACGVRLASGEVLSGADVVVVNADLVYAYGALFPPSASAETKRYAASLRRRPASCSAVCFYWSLDVRVRELQTAHSVFLADQYRESFEAIFGPRRALPASPSFYVHAPSRVDPTAAPPGGDALVVLVPTGHLSPSPGEGDGEAEEDDRELLPAVVARARAAVLATLSARTGCADLAGHILQETVNDPVTWRDRFNLDRGSILGISHSFDNVLAFRPPTRAVGAGAENTYFVGASTHPGTGVPIVLAGAKITAEQILGDLGIVPPWPPGDSSNEKTAPTSELDRLCSPPVSYRTWFIGVVVALLVAYLLAKYYTLLQRTEL
ncbi:hypothetical protein F5X96DRAFT_679637 [Biscogniauxia mediterranea]|nr:hypothetical protein F5X96DRAFT_679637 [Biscogniauxia mediterranea]